jgi:hypothetical protein
VNVGLYPDTIEKPDQKRFGALNRKVAKYDTNRLFGNDIAIRSPYGY